MKFSFPDQSSRSKNSTCGLANETDCRQTRGDRLARLALPYGAAALGITAITLVISNGPRAASAHADHRADEALLRQMRELSQAQAQYQIGSPEWPLPVDSISESPVPAKVSPPCCELSKPALEFPAEYSPR